MLGGVLLQTHDGQLRPVAYCSRTLPDAEKCYAQIEKECFTVVWACEKFTSYLYGLDSFTLQSDHKPLIPLINSKYLDAVLMKCQRLLLRMMWYNYTAEYVPGKQLVIVDTLYRHTLNTALREITGLTSELDAYEEAVWEAWPITPSELDIVKQQTLQDAELQLVKD